MAMRPPIPALILSRRAKISLITVAIIIVLLVVLSSLVGVYIDWLWFGSVGFRSVYRSVIETRAVLFLIFGLLMALGVCANVIVAYPPPAAVPSDLAGTAESRAVPRGARAAQAPDHLRDLRGLSDSEPACRLRVTGAPGCCGSTAAPSE